MKRNVSLGIIGGSGLYDFPALEEKEQVLEHTPFGNPSSPIMIGKLAGKHVAFIARHGIGHFYSPSEVNYRANIYAMKSLGVKNIISVSACGSLRQDYSPGDIVIPDQIFDFTHKRERSFFGSGAVAHISAAEPFCPDLSERMVAAVRQSGAKVHTSGTFITIEGPRFSTKAESNVYRTWGMSIIGMTASPEVFLAREAEICYTTMAHVTDYDVWHTSEKPVTVEMVMKILMANTEIAQQSILNLIERLPEEKTCACGHALKDAVMTRRDLIPDETNKKLDLFLSKYR